MNLYPNYNSLNNFFINNFNDYTKFVNELHDLNFNDSIKVFDKIQNKLTDLNDNYNSKIFLIFENFIIDSYLNIFNKDINQLEIQNYIQFPPYILYLIKDTFTIKSCTEDLCYAKGLLKLTKYVIMHNDNDIENDEKDIEDTIYLKNQIKEYKSKLSEKEYIILKKEEKTKEHLKIISELKLKLRKANFTLMENQNIFSELHVDINEKDLEIEKQKQEINKQKQEIEKKIEEINKQKQEINKQKQEIETQKKELYYYESSILYYTYKYFYDIYDGLYIFISRIRF
jgi:vacuolar-type H+-ATPase subunit I/STV1